MITVVFLLVLWWGTYLIRVTALQLLYSQPGFHHIGRC